MGYAAFLTAIKNYVARRQQVWMELPYMDRELAKRYFFALEELAHDGNEAAQAALDAIMLRPDERGRIADHGIDIVNWARNIHENVWGTNNLGALLKARVAFNRFKDAE